MGREGLPQIGNIEFTGAGEQRIAALREEMTLYGGEEVIRARIGLGAEELAQEVKFASYEGRLWEAVVDSFKPGQAGKDKPQCPLGDNLQEAFQAGQTEAVIQKLEIYKMLDSRFTVVVSPKTRVHAENLKKK